MRKQSGRIPGVPLERAPILRLYIDLCVLRSRIRKAGRGLYAWRNLPANALIPYEGKVLTGPEVLALPPERRKYLVSRECNGKVLGGCEGFESLDGLKHGATMINHVPYDHEAKNCAFVYLPSLGRMGFFVKLLRSIRRKEELYICYESPRGEEFFDEEPMADFTQKDPWVEEFGSSQPAGESLVPSPVVEQEDTSGISSQVSADLSFEVSQDFKNRQEEEETGFEEDGEEEDEVEELVGDKNQGCSECARLNARIQELEEELRKAGEEKKRGASKRKRKKMIRQAGGPAEEETEGAAEEERAAPERGKERRRKDEKKKEEEKREKVQEEQQGNTGISAKDEGDDEDSEDGDEAEEVLNEVKDQKRSRGRPRKSQDPRFGRGGKNGGKPRGQPRKKLQTAENNSESEEY